MKSVLIVFVLTLTSIAQDPAHLSSTQQIVSRMAAMNEARSAALHSYSGTRTYQVSYKGFPKSLSAKALVRLDYSAPDKKNFTIFRQEGSSLLVNKVIKKALESELEAAKPDFRSRSALDETNYTFKFVRSDSEAGRPCYLLQVTPKREDKYLYDGQVCIDEADYAVARIEAKPAKNPSFWISKASIDHHNQKVGDFWLPRLNDSTSHVRLGGDAELKIIYDDYKVTSASAMQGTSTSPAPATQ